MPNFVYVWRGELLDGRGYEAEGGEVMGVTEGGLSALVGQRKCLMLYADELMLYLSLWFSERCTLNATSIPTTSHTRTIPTHLEA